MILPKQDYLQASIEIIQDWLDNIEKIDKLLTTKSIEVREVQGQELQEGENNLTEKRTILPVQLPSGKKLNQKLGNLYKVLQKVEHRLHNLQSDQLLDKITSSLKTYQPIKKYFDDIKNKIKQHKVDLVHIMPGQQASNPTIDIQEQNTKLISNSRLKGLDNMIRDFALLTDDQELIDLSKKVQDTKKQAVKQKANQELKEFQENIQQSFDDIDF